MTRYQNQLFYRSFELDRATVNRDQRSVEVSFSSETPVQRWFGAEILLHGVDNVNLARLRSMGAALLNHNPDRIIGRVEGAKLEGKRGKATVIFDDDEDGNRAMAKVESGSLRGVSVGYSIEKIRRVEEKEEWNGIKGTAYVATRWAPYEISLTPIPADASVGVGRDLSRSLDGIEIEEEQNDMTLEELRAQIEKEREEFAKRMKTLEDTITAMPGQIADQLRQQQEQSNKPQIRVTPEEYGELLSRATAISPDAVCQFSGWVAEGQDARAIQGKLLDLAIGRTDARDAGGEPEAQKKKTGGEQTPSGYRSLKDMDDDTFLRGLTSPTVSM